MRLPKEEFRQVFTDRAEQLGFDVDQTYSGRGMYGEVCPSVIIEGMYDAFDFAAETGLSGFEYDNMGHDIVIYARGGGVDYREDF